MYTVQINAYGNAIVCKGSDVRNSYRVVFTGTYAHCLRMSAACALSRESGQGVKFKLA